jgi:hypothetical protein
MYHHRSFVRPLLVALGRIPSQPRGAERWMRVERYVSGNTHQTYRRVLLFTWRHEAAFGETVPANLRGSSGAAGDFAGKGTVCHVCSGAQLVSAICLAYGTMWPRRITAHRSNASSRVAADTGLRRRRFLLGRQISGSFASAIATIARATHAHGRKTPTASAADDHHFWSLLMLAITASAFLLVTWGATKVLFFFLQQAPIP